jgi:hypothetical protein
MGCSLDNVAVRILFFRKGQPRTRSELLQTVAHAQIPRETVSETSSKSVRIGALTFRVTIPKDRQLMENAERIASRRFAFPPSQISKREEPHRCLPFAERQGSKTLIPSGCDFSRN